MKSIGIGFGIGFGSNMIEPIPPIEEQVLLLEGGDEILLENNEPILLENQNE